MQLGLVKRQNMQDIGGHKTTLKVTMTLAQR